MPAVVPEGIWGLVCAWHFPTEGGGVLSVSIACWKKAVLVIGLFTRVCGGLLIWHKSKLSPATCRTPDIPRSLMSLAEYKADEAHPG
jgi:hypothetical protein